MIFRRGGASAIQTRGGFALVEAVVSTLIVGSLLVATLSVLASAGRSRQVQAAQRLGPALARRWMAEILQADYRDIDSALEDGVIDGWRREVTVEYVEPGDPSIVAASDRGIKRVTVTATAPSGRPTRLVALRSSGSIYDLMPRAERTYVTRIGAELQIGHSAAGRVKTGVNLLNRIPATEQ